MNDQPVRIGKVQQAPKISAEAKPNWSSTARSLRWSPGGGERTS
jgi:hypothetical protein